MDPSLLDAETEAGEVALFAAFRESLAALGDAIADLWRVSSTLASLSSIRTSISVALVTLGNLISAA